MMGFAKIVTRTGPEDAIQILATKDPAAVGGEAAVGVVEATDTIVVCQSSYLASSSTRRLLNEGSAITSNKPINLGALQPGSPSGTTSKLAKPLQKLTRQPSQSTARKNRLAERLDGMIREQLDLDGMIRKQLVDRAGGTAPRMQFQIVKASPRATTLRPTRLQVNRPPNRSRKTTANHTPTISPSRPRRSSD